MNDLAQDKNPIRFANESNDSGSEKLLPWKILIVDDEREIHNITQMVLSGIQFQNRKVTFLHAYSGEEAIIQIQQEKDIAVVLLDVVMETENAGLIVAKKIREELNNNEIRIILRTGHPGYAPENKIIIDYDINDYKEKTELTSQKLITTVIASLRAYEDIITIKDLNQNLEALVEKRTQALENANIKLEKTLRMLREDLEAGRRIQFRLLPVRDKEYDGYTFSRFLVPSLYLSGDFVDYFMIDEDNIGFYFADVCGHGASSAFITVLLKSLIDNYIKGEEEHSKHYLENPAKFLTEINMQMINENVDKHTTLFYGVLNSVNNTLKFAHGGQFPHPIFRTSDNIRFLDNAGGMPLGLYREAEYTEHIVQLDEKFLILIFSDGILEILNEDTLVEKQNYLLSKIERLDYNYQDILKIFDINSSAELMDDITFLMIKR